MTNTLPVPIAHPLCVDLDGTLICTDVTWLSVRYLMSHAPLRLMFSVLSTLWRSRAAFKHQLACVYIPDPSKLDYTESILSLIKEARAEGRKTVLATACDVSIAKAVAQYLGIFDDVIASDGHTNRRAQAKADILCQRYGAKNFVYIGNSWDDLAVWRQASYGIAIRASKATLTQAYKHNLNLTILSS